MLTFGHTAVSYLISQASRLKHRTLGWKEIVFILFCGNVFDLDFLIPETFSYPYPGGAHHLLPTHTPLVGFILFTTLFLFLRKKFSGETFALAGIAMIGHLVLDDLAYWLYLLGIHKVGSPQIFWLYPFDPRRNLEIRRFINLNAQKHYTNIDILKNYIFNGPVVFALEIALVLVALYVFIRGKRPEGRDSQPN